MKTETQLQNSDILLPGIFTVNENGKKVQFTKGNLKKSRKENKYFFSICDKQYDVDIKNSEEPEDMHWVDIIDEYKNSPELSEFSILTMEEWKYLLDHNTAKNSSGGNLHKIIDKNCIILTPDNYSSSIKDNYTEDEWKNAEKENLIALPSAGYLYDDVVDYVRDYNRMGCYRSSTLGKLSWYNGIIAFTDYSIETGIDESPNSYCIRLVKEI